MGIPRKLGGIAEAQRHAADLKREFKAAGGQVGLLHPPRREGGKWVVTVEDVLGDKLDKVFGSESRAMDFYTELWLGMSRTEAKAAASDGDLPGRDTSTLDHDGGVFVGGQQVSRAETAARTPSHGTRRSPLNLRKVSEVLSSYGMDPTVELAEILTPTLHVDPETGVEVEMHRLPPEDRAKILLELLQYAHPKLKAVEMKVEGTLAGMTQEQIDQRLQQLIAKAAKA